MISSRWIVSAGFVPGKGSFRRFRRAWDQARTFATRPPPLAGFVTPDVRFGATRSARNHARTLDASWPKRVLSRATSGCRTAVQRCSTSDRAK